MEALHRFCLYPKFTYAKYQLLKKFFFTFDEAWNAPSNKLIHAGFSKDATHEFLLWKNKFDDELYSPILEHDSISIVSVEDSGYPPTVKHLYDPPVALFVRGVFDNTRPRLAIVGTRKMTTYGRQVTEEITEELVAHGIEIVSGLALGIDGVAHKTALAADGTTVAVLGSGVDRTTVYPRAHYELAHAIIDNGGALVSEYPPLNKPTPYSFPKRNRIIAGLSLGTLVVEADEKSGALITASCALEYGRDVYAVPHALTSPTGKGPHQLIRDGAYLVRNAADILDNLPLSDFKRHTRTQETMPDTPDESRLLAHLSTEALHIDEIIRRIQLPSSEVTALLTVLEMKGRVKNIGNMTYTFKK